LAEALENNNNNIINKFKYKHLLKPVNTESIPNVDIPETTEATSSMAAAAAALAALTLSSS
jgi:hypothetical protein